MKVFVALACVLAAVSATPLFGTEQCAKGPEAWCQNVQSASQCGAVMHCRQTVWNKPTVKSVECDLCKEMVTVLVNYLKDNITQAEIKEYLNKICQLCPDPSLTSACQQAISDYFPLVLNILEEELSNPGVFCSSIGMCKSLQRYLAGLKQPQQLMTNEIPENDASEMVYPFLANVPLLLYPQEKTPQEPKNGDVCGDCIQLLTDLQDNIRGNSTYSKEFLQRLLSQCDRLGPGVSDMCKSYINQYSDMAIQMLLQMKAKEICEAGGLCSQTKSTPLQELIPAKTVPAVKLQPSIPALELQPAVKSLEESPVDQGPTCALCKMLVEEVENLLENNRTEAKIRHALEKVCGILPKKYRNQCVDIVDQYSEAIIKLLEQEATPQMVCCSLGLCSFKQRPQNVKLNPEKVRSGDYCSVCKMVMKYVDQLLEKNSTEIRIRNFLNKICNFLPETMQQECSAMITQYEPLFVQLLLEALDPSFICTQVHLCPSMKPLLGTEKCMWGPSYWCKDVETATSCDALEHCKRHVWN
ncbi:prosaposin [Rhinophrynus dorsalis]